MTADAMFSGRVPPYDQQAEAAVLGGLLLAPQRLPEVRNRLDPAAFFVEAYRRIYTAILELAEAGRAIDHVTIGGHLKDAGQLDKIGGVKALSDLTEQVATAANVEHYAQIVADKAAVRAVIYAATQIVAEGYAGVDDPAAWMAACQQAFSAATAPTLLAGNDPQVLDPELSEALKYLEQQGTPPGVVPVSIGEVDAYTGGLWPGQVTILAARPSMGKSCFLLNVAYNAARAGKVVLYFSLEDTRFIAALRLLSRLADVDLQALTLRRLRHEDWPRLIAGASAAHRLPLYMVDTDGLTTAQMYQIAAAFKAKRGLDLVIADHLDEAGDDTGENETANTSARARGFRRIAKNLHVPMLLAHQLNRDVEKRADKRPMVSDLRQSGTVEAVARSVWLLYRPFFYSGEAAEEHDLELIVGKTNHGRTGTIRLWCDLSRMYVRGYNQDETPPQQGRQLRPVRDSAAGRDEW